MFKSVKKLLALTALSALLIGNSAFAISFNPISSPQYLKLTGVALEGISSSYELGSSGNPWAKGYFTDLDVAGVFSFGGAMSSDLDMNGYDILDALNVESGTGGRISSYNTADTTVNFEALDLEWTSNQATLSTRFGGTASQRALYLRGYNLNNIGNGYIALNGVAPFISMGATATSSAGSIVDFAFQSTAGAGDVVFWNIDPDVAQTGTAGYKVMKLNPRVVTNGSGDQDLLWVGADDVKFLGVDYSGVTTITEAGGDSVSLEHDGTDGIISSSAGLMVVEGNTGLELGNATDVMATITNNTSATSIVPTTGDILQVGDAGATSAGLVDNDDLFVSGKLEVDANGYFDAGIILNGNMDMQDNKSITMGSGDDTTLKYSVAQLSDTLFWGFDQDNGNSLIIGTFSNANKNFDHAAQTNPTVFIHSLTDPDTDNTQYLSIAHDQTDAVIGVGTGGLNVELAGTPEYELTAANFFLDATVTRLTNGTALNLYGRRSDGSGNPGVVINNSNTLATDGDVVLSVQNNGTELALIDYKGVYEAVLSVGDGEANEDAAVVVAHTLNDTTTADGTAGDYKAIAVEVTDTDSSAYANTYAFVVGQTGMEALTIGLDGELSLNDGSNSAMHYMDSGNYMTEFTSNSYRKDFGVVQGVTIGDSITNSVGKTMRLGSMHYNTAEEPFYGLVSLADSGVNELNLGGGTSVGNAATSVRLYLAGNNTTVTGDRMLEFAQSLPSAFAKDTDANAPELYIRAMDGGTDSNSSGGNAGSGIHWMAGEGSNAEQFSNQDGGDGGSYTFTLASGGAGDGTGQQGENGTLLIVGTGGNDLFEFNDGGFLSLMSQSGEARLSSQGGSTSGAATSVVYTYYTDDDVATYLYGHVSGIKSDGSEVGFYEIDAGYQNDGGTLTEQFDNSSAVSEDDANWDCTIAPNGTNVEVTCGSAAAGDDITWQVYLTANDAAVTP